MAETLGSLCDKLTIIKLKEWHSAKRSQLKSLAGQEAQIKEEMGGFVRDAVCGRIPADRLTFASNKVLVKVNKKSSIAGGIGELVSRLALANCELWHEQEKVYMRKNVLCKEGLLKKLALLNLERNNCIERIDRRFCQAIKKA